MTPSVSYTAGTRAWCTEFSSRAFRSSEAEDMVQDVFLSADEGGLWLLPWQLKPNCGDRSPR